MRSGLETLRAVFDAVTAGSLATKREIADKTGISRVSVSKAANELIRAGLLSVDGSVATGGRRSDFLCPAYGVTHLAINLCEKPFSYALAYLGEELSANGSPSASVKYVPYLHDLDFGENVALLAKAISDEGQRIYSTAVAMPDDSRFPADYLGDDIGEILERYGIIPEVTATGLEAIAASPTVKKALSPAVYVSVSDGVRGIYFGDSVIELDWNGLKADGLSFSEILKCSSCAATLTARVERLLNMISEVLSARSLLLDTNALSAEVVEELLDRIGTLEDVTFSAPLLSGLISLLADHKMRMIPSAHASRKNNFN